MKVRDKTKPKTEYLGRETEAVDSKCPCRECYDYDYPPKTLCRHNANHGCPDPMPESEHIWKV